MVCVGPPRWGPTGASSRRPDLATPVSQLISSLGWWLLPPTQLVVCCPHRCGNMRSRMLPTLVRQHALHSAAQCWVADASGHTATGIGGGVAGYGAS